VSDCVWALSHHTTYQHTVANKGTLSVCEWQRGSRAQSDLSSTTEFSMRKRCSAAFWSGDSSTSILLSGDPHSLTHASLQAKHPNGDERNRMLKISSGFRISSKPGFQSCATHRAADFMLWVCGLQNARSTDACARY
jgi:hypothetical protein